jgi:hypothetical protein
VVFTRLFVFIHDVAQLSEVLFHLVLDDLAVTLLYPSEVGLSLSQLIFAIKNQRFGRLYFQFDLSHNIRDDIKFTCG